MYYIQQVYSRCIVCFLLWEIGRNIPTEGKKIKCFGWHLRWFHGMEICRTGINLELLCEIWLQHCKFIQHRGWWQKLRLVGAMAPQCWPQWFWWVFNVNKSIPTAGDQPTNFDSPSPSSMYVMARKRRRWRKYGSFLSIRLIECYWCWWCWIW